MSGKGGAGGVEGWESLSEEEESGGSLAVNPELEEALREAADAVETPAPREKAAAAEANPSSASGDLAVLEAEIERLRAEVEAGKDRMVRFQADFENFRRRAAKERQEILEYGHENLVKDLLSTVDNLGRAIDHARQSGTADLEVLLQGVELVQREFHAALGAHGLTEIDALGKPFDPALHEAMAHEPDASVPPGTVIEVLQKGYQLKAHLVRPARVTVAKAPEADAEDRGPDAG